MKLISVTVFSIVLLKVIDCRSVNKCCKPEETFVKTGDSFQCSEDLNKRVQVRANTTDFLKQNKRGLCFEALDSDVITLNISAEGVSVQRVTVSFFPKCCPLGYVYNAITHGCVKKPSPADFLKEPFVKVGLTNCRLVVDTILHGTDDFQYTLLNHTGRYQRNVLYPGSFCIDKTENESLVLRECQESLRTCDTIKCVKKCCPDGQSFVNGSKCVNTYEHGLNLSVFGNAVEKPNDPYATIYNTTCTKIYKMDQNEFNFTLHSGGTFTEFYSEGYHEVDVGDLHSYCVEHSKKNGFEGFFFFYCFPESDDSSTKFDYTFWPMVMSCIFLVLTIFIYVALKETRKMFGKILVNYCMATFFSFAFLIVAQLNDTPTAEECQIKAFSIIFFASASFTWSNIMCWDIWCTFGTTRLYLGTTQRKMDFTKLLVYSLYGWGVPLLLTLVIFVFHKWKVLPYSIQPFLAEVKCFFDTKRGNYAKDLFYNIPLLIIQLVNMVLFIKTVLYCLEVKNDINKINDTTKNEKMKRYHSDKERLFLILKLLVIMGMSYIFEVVSAFFDMSEMGFIPKYIEIIWDTINALQGVFIFVIFICKRRIIFHCLRKFNTTVERKSSDSSSFNTQSTLHVNGFSLNRMGHINKGFM
nr:probable G-protein coupled receptor Mth-like 2 [Leptinotarsa decemlineata]